MPQATDVVIDGAGYMLAPGKYQRGQDGAPDGRTGRVAFRDFFGGQRRHLQLERDKGFAGVNVGPALNGQGVQPIGRTNQLTMSPAFPVTPSRSTRIPYAWVRGNLYFALGANVYRVESGTTPPVLETTRPQVVTDMCIYAENGLLLAYGGAADIDFYSVTANASQVLLAGHRGTHLGPYMGYAMWNDERASARPSYVDMVTGTGTDTRILDHPIIGFRNAGAKIYALSRQNVYSFTGRVREVSDDNPAYVNPTTTPNEPPTIKVHQWAGEFEPFAQHGVWSAADDYRVFEGFGGDVFAWVSGRMMRFKATGERAGWQDTGLSGRECLGGCVAAGYLIVSLISTEDRNELWAWDGSGWWRILEKASAATGNWVWPLPLQGSHGLRDVLLFHEGSQTLTAIRLAHRDPDHAFPPSGEFVTSMIDAAERDKDKSWRKIGAVFATPERNGNLASTDTLTMYLDYSIDGGATWTNAVPTGRSGNDASEQTFVMEATIATPPSSRFLMLRVRWFQILDWAPILTGLWAEFEILDSPARRRRWSFDVVAADQTIDRDGATLSRTGRQLIAELWTAWQDGSTVTFRDIDYDADPTERTVRIVGISEKAHKPSDAGRWGDSVVSMVLVEV